MPKKKKEDTVWPKVTKGSHLTVYTDENGKTTLEWDDEALARDVAEALASVKSTPVKKTRAKKVKED
jgi:hypothetical protein